MFRKDLIEILVEQPCTVEELAELLETKQKNVEQDLRHLLRSLRHQPYRVILTPPRCKHCGFDRFKPGKLQKPSRCPKCKSGFVEPPTVYLKRTK